MLERFEDECAYATRCVNAWMKKGIPANEIAIICFQKWQGEVVSAQLANHGIDHLWTGAPGGKKSYDPAAEKITVITAQSSKGLEFQSVIVLGTGSLKDDEESASDQTRLLYVAMTRAKRQLAISASARNRHTRRLEGLDEVMMGA